MRTVGKFEIFINIIVFTLAWCTMEWIDNIFYTMLCGIGAFFYGLLYDAIWLEWDKTQNK